jgi:preprotein translocase subunit YajC
MITADILLGQAAGGGGTNMIFMLLIMGVFFVFMILPQMRKQKKTKAFNATLVKGNHIVTASGIHGKISKMNETNLLIDLEDGQTMKIELAAVSMELSSANYPDDYPGLAKKK